MNENIDLTKILKDCPKGTKLYSPVFGKVELKVIGDNKYPIITTHQQEMIVVSQPLRSRVFIINEKT